MNNIIFKTILVLSVALLLGSGQGIFAQEEAAGKGIAVHTGPEWNMNSRNNFAGRLALGIDYSLPSLSLAVGLGVAGSYNFSNAAVIEADTFLRWYFPKMRHEGFFAQADLGFYYIMENLYGYRETTPMFLGGLRAGYRLPLGQSFFIEPYARSGYPFAFGIGIITGIRF